MTDITYIRTHEGWLYLAAVLDLFSRQVIGWSMGSRMDRELALNALLMAVWRRQPKQTVMVQLASTFLGLEHVKLISLGNAVQALRPVVLG